MRYAWDARKAVHNLERHGVALTAVEGFEWAHALVRADTRFDYGEVRLNALAPIGDRLHHLTFTVERRTVRLISLRRASNREIDRYEAEAAAQHPG